MSMFGVSAQVDAPFSAVLIPRPLLTARTECVSGCLSFPQVDNLFLNR